jgi:hypothetical protein
MPVFLYTQWIIMSVCFCQIVNPHNKNIPDIPGLAPPAMNRRLLSIEPFGGFWACSAVQFSRPIQLLLSGSTRCINSFVLVDCHLLSMSQISVDPFFPCWSLGFVVFDSLRWLGFLLVCICDADEDARFYMIFLVSYAHMNDSFGV